MSRAEKSDKGGGSGRAGGWVRMDSSALLQCGALMDGYLRWEDELEAGSPQSNTLARAGKRILDDLCDRQSERGRLKVSNAAPIVFRNERSTRAFPLHRRFMFYETSGPHASTPIVRSRLNAGSFLTTSAQIDTLSARRLAGSFAASRLAQKVGAPHFRSL